MENKFVPEDELRDKFVSKRDLYDALRFQFDLHLPSYRRCPLKFIKDVFRGKKQLYSNMEVNKSSIPRFRELSVAKLWDTLKDNEKFVSFMPDYRNDQAPERDYFFGVLSTMYPEQLKDLVNQSYSARRSYYMKGNEETVEITDSILANIGGIISYKTTPGRGLALLKVKNMNQRNHRREHIFKPDLSAFQEAHPADEKSSPISKSRETRVSHKAPDIQMREDNKEDNN